MLLKLRGEHVSVAGHGIVINEMQAALLADAAGLAAVTAM
jgi:hypothetical protein